MATVQRTAATGKPPKRNETDPTESEEEEELERQNDAVRRELEQSRLCDAAVDAWDEAQRYLRHKGAPVLDRCTFPEFMRFCERVLEERDEDLRAQLVASQQT